MIGNNIMEKYFSELIEKELKYQTLDNLLDNLIDDISGELENKYSFCGRVPSGSPILTSTLSDSINIELPCRAW